MILGRNKSLMMAALFAAATGSNFGSMASPMPAANFTSPGFRRGRNAGKANPAGSKLANKAAKNKAKAQRRKGK